MKQIFLMNFAFIEFFVFTLKIYSEFSACSFYEH